MNAPQIIYVLRWLIRDTFRQALAGKVFWIMLAVSGLCILFCLGVGIEGGNNLRPEKHTRELFDPVTNQPLTQATPNLGKLHLLFGLFKVDLTRDRENEVHLLHVIFASWVAGTAGLLLTLVWTAGFLPDFLQASNAAVLFAKPIPRWLHLVGKYLGVVLFVAFQAVVFFGGTWLALCLRTDVWLYGYLAGIPLAIVSFAVFYSFSVLLASCTRSTVACVLGCVLFWAVCMGMNYARHSAVALPRLAPGTPALPASTMFVIDAGYWLLPKPADFGMMLEQALSAGTHMATLSALPEFSKVLEMDALDPLGVVFSSMLFSVVMLGMAGWQLAKLDY